MKRFKNILMLYTQRAGDEAALNRATELARKNGARLTVVEIHENAPAPITAFFKERRAHLERLIDSARFEGVEVDCRVLQGLQFLELTRLVLKDGYDLVVMTADRVNGYQNLSFGTGSMHVMRKCPCPVWVMQPESQGHFRRIMAAVAPAGNRAANPLDLKILQMASSLARAENAQLEIVHAWNFTGKDLDTSRSEITSRIREELLSRNEWARRKMLDESIKQVDLDGVEHELHLVHGEPELEIPRFANEKNIDLIVMGTLTRGGIPGFLIGSTAENLLRMIDCSVLTVKPDDFITPVSLAG